MARQTKRMKIREQIASERGPVEVKKPRKKRKPMTEEQKAAAAERLAKAREKKMEEQGPPKSVHPDVLAKPDDDPLSLKNVREWIKTQKDLLSSLRRDAKADVKGALAKSIACEGYIRNLERYIRDGIYLDMFYGEYGEKRMRTVCLVPAYDKDGNMKRSYGCYYRDLGGVYVGPGRVEIDGVIHEVDYV